MSLSSATSPFLLSHKDNPIQWRTWGPEALAEAKAQDKPILLSLGYIGCHWCHVMNREGFSDAELATLINDNYIPILADRDERPDLDMLYQGAAALMGHPGGWPLNVFLNPEGAPFWVTGYLPQQAPPEQPSFGRVIADNVAMWTSDRARADGIAAQVRQAVENLYNRDMSVGQEGVDLDFAALRLAQRYDIFFGGLLGQMKFPNTPLLEVLWRAFLRTGTPQFNQVIFTTLDALLFGAGYDHVGGGFFRHCLDERWAEPSFEKTLYDQALLIDFCTSIWQFNRNELCRQRVAETVNFLMHEMKAGNAFAYSISSGSQIEDGKYYTWSEAEIDAGLSGTFSARFKQVYGITRDGNVMGRNLPRRPGNPAPASEADEVLLAKQREMLLALRDKRARPVRDDRATANGNGLIIAALSRAGMVFERPDWLQAAIAAFDTIVKDLGGEENTLSHVAGSAGVADDYADMSRAALQLFEVTGDQRFLEKAKAWVQVLESHFWNNQIGGYCFYADNAEQLFSRPRMVFDNPCPSANGTMLTVLTRLALLTGIPEYRDRASALSNTFGNEANRMPTGAGTYLSGLEYLLNSLVVVVVGHKGHTKTQELLRAYWGKPVPNGMVVQMEPGEPLPPGHPASGRGMQGGHPTAYICQAGNCSEGITNGNELAWVLTLPVQLRTQIQQQAQQAQQARS
jgi:uncharacterized protein YyaL (SSP411 family)